MDNELLFKNLQSNYDSLKFFALKNYVLYFKDTDKLYSLPLRTVNIFSLNPNLFLLKPRDIYRIIYLLEILAKDEINEYDQNFIIQYTQKYLKLEDERIDNNDLDENEIICLRIPIYTSYDPMYQNKPASILIHSLLDKHSEEIESGKYHGQKLVLVKPNLPALIDEEPLDFVDLGKAGFTVTFLIILTIILTSAYIAFFVINK